MIEKNWVVTLMEKMQEMCIEYCRLNKRQHAKIFTKRYQRKQVANRGSDSNFHITLSQCATIKLHSQRNVSMPDVRMKADEPGHDWFYQGVHDNTVLVIVSIVYLQKKNTSKEYVSREFGLIAKKLMFNQVLLYPFQITPLCLVYLRIKCFKGFDYDMI